MNDRPILLVEDNPDDAFLSLRTLKKCGLDNVIETRDGEEALDFLFGQGNYADRGPASPPWFVLLDMKLPKVDGIEFLEIIRAKTESRELPVIVISSSREERGVEKCRQLGVSVYLTKPLDREALTTALRELGLE